MGDLITTDGNKPRETSMFSIQNPILTATNYTVWAIRISVSLKVHKVWDCIEPGSNDSQKNNLAIAIILQSIPENLVLQIGGLTTAKGVWEAIRLRNIRVERVKEARLQTLMNDFEKLKMKDSDKIDDFVGKISELASKSTSLGKSIEEPRLVKKFLTSLPHKKFIHIIAALEQMLDLDNTSFEDIVGRLKAYEEHINDEESHEENTNKLLYANSDTRTSEPPNFEPKFRGNYGAYRGNCGSFRGNFGESRGGYGDSRYRGRGGRFYGRGRGRSHDYFDNRHKEYMARITCYRCDKIGHMATDCPDRLLKLQEVHESENDDTQAAENLMMHEVVMLNENKIKPGDFEIHTCEENMWYLDNGASNHMTGNLSYFGATDERISGKVRFGDDTRIDIKGKGSITIVTKNGDQRTINDVYFVPELRSNIISLGQATENGCDVRMREGSYLT